MIVDFQVQAKKINIEISLSDRVSRLLSGCIEISLFKR